MLNENINDLWNKVRDHENKERTYLEEIEKLKRELQDIDLKRQEHEILKKIEEAYDKQQKQHMSLRVEKSRSEEQT